MVPLVQSLPSHLPPSILPTAHFSRSSLYLPKPIRRTQFVQFKANPSLRFSFQPLKCLVSVVAEPTPLELTSNAKPWPAEVSRTIMELSSVGILSTLTQEGWPLGIGVRFAVDSQGTPVLCLNDSAKKLFTDSRSSLHVQLEQCGLRTPQCSVVGSLDRPGDTMASKDGIWVTSTDYKLANPDLLQDFAEKLVHEINAHNSEDVYRFCNIYADLDFQVLDAKMVWVDRLGFDIRVRSAENNVFEV